MISQLLHLPFYSPKNIFISQEARVWAWELKMLCFSCTDANWNIQPLSSFTFEVGYFALCPEKILCEQNTLCTCQDTDLAMSGTYVCK